MKAVGIVILIGLAVYVAMIVAQPSWKAGNVRTTYQQCMSVAQTAADQRACNPTIPTPTPR